MSTQVSISPTEFLFKVSDFSSVFTRFMASTMTIEAIAYVDVAAGEELHLSCKYPLSHPHPLDWRDKD